MTPVEIVKARVEAALDRPMFHEGIIPAADAREAILAALDEPLPVEEQAS